MIAVIATRWSSGVGKSISEFVIANNNEWELKNLFEI